MYVGTTSGGNKAIRNSSVSLDLSTAFSMSCQMRAVGTPGAPGTNSFLFSVLVSGTDEAGFAWDHGNSNYQGAFYRRANETWPSVKAGAWTSGTEYGLAACFDNSVGTKFYRNGVNQGTNVNTSGEANASYDVNVVNSGSGGYECDCPVGEAAIWAGVALTTDELAALSNGISPLLVRPNDLSLYWRCLAAHGTTILDESGNGNNGTLTSTPVVAVHTSKIIMPNSVVMLPLAVGAAPVGGALHSGSLSLLGVGM